MEQLSGVQVNEKKSGKLKFRMYITQKMNDTSIDALDLSVRSNNSLRRAGFKCIGDIADALAKGMELANIRNCGAKSRREIMEKMFLFQYYSLAEKKREAYLREVVELNQTC